MSNEEILDFKEIDSQNLIKNYISYFRKKIRDGFRITIKLVADADQKQLDNSQQSNLCLSSSDSHRRPPESVKKVDLNGQKQGGKKIQVLGDQSEPPDQQANILLKAPQSRNLTKKNLDKNKLRPQPIEIQIDDVQQQSVMSSMYNETQQQFNLLENFQNISTPSHNKDTNQSRKIQKQISHENRQEVIEKSDISFNFDTKRLVNQNNESDRNKNYISQAQSKQEKHFLKSEILTQKLDLISNFLKYSTPLPQLDSKLSLENVDDGVDDEGEDDLLEASSPVQMHQNLQDYLGMYKSGQLTTASKRIKKIQKQTFINMKSMSKIETHSNYVVGVKCLIYRAKIYRSLGDLEKACQTLEQSLKIFNINDQAIYGNILNELGQLTYIQLKFDLANKYFYDALIHYERLNWKAEIANTLRQLSLVYAFLKLDDEAMKLCYESLLIYRQFLPESDIRISQTYQTLGHIYFLNSNFEFAIEYFKKSIQIIKDLEGALHPINIDSYNLLGLTNVQTHKLGEAIQCFKLALSNFEYQIVYPKIDRNVTSIKMAQVLQNLALTYLLHRRLKKSEACFQKALEILQEYINKDNPLALRLIRNKEVLEKILKCQNE